MTKMRGTTIIAIRRGGLVTVAGDGQVTFDVTIMKHGARKVRRLYHNKVIVGFAARRRMPSPCSTVSTRSWSNTTAISARGGGIDQGLADGPCLRHLEALMIAVSRDHFLLISGNGDVIESDDEVMAIGSGAPYALAAARALVRFSELTATEIAREAVRIASEICIYTNDNITVEELEINDDN